MTFTSLISVLVLFWSDVWPLTQVCAIKVVRNNSSWQLSCHYGVMMHRSKILLHIRKTQAVISISHLQSSFYRIEIKNKNRKGHPLLLLLRWLSSSNSSNFIGNAKLISYHFPKLLLPNYFVCLRQNSAYDCANFLNKFQRPRFLEPDKSSDMIHQYT